MRFYLISRCQGYEGTFKGHGVSGIHCGRLEAVHRESLPTNPQQIWRTAAATSRTRPGEHDGQGQSEPDRATEFPVVWVTV